MNKTVSLALGTFDGIHKGHRAVLDAALSANTDLKVAVTFTCPPKSVYNPEILPLMSTEEKIGRLSDCGFDEVYTLDFTAVKDESPEEFLGDLFDRYKVKFISCGFNYRFGKDGKGDTELLKKYAESKSAELFVCPPVCHKGEPISSSRIREAIKTGDIKEANEMLGHPYSITAPVVHGNERGRTIGLPTVNQIPKGTVLPKNGVYKSITVIDKKRFDSMTNIGIRPTFLQDFVGLETHIFDFKGDLYGKEITVEPICYLRPEKRFDSIDKLKEAILEDIKNCKGGE